MHHAPRSYLDAIADLRTVREQNIALTEHLSQEQLDAVPKPGRWSVGEVLDHLVRADQMFQREIGAVIEKQRQGRPPYVYRNLRQAGAPVIGRLPLPFRLPFEGAFFFFNLGVPATVREGFLGQRQVRAQAPEMLRPRPRRPRADLFTDLRASLDQLDHLGQDTGLDLDAGLYYSPLFGFTKVAGLLRLLAQHDRRHQGQIQEAVAALE